MVAAACLGMQIWASDAGKSPAQLAFVRVGQADIGASLAYLPFRWPQWGLCHFQKPWRAALC